MASRARSLIRRLPLLFLFTTVLGTGGMSGIPATTVSATGADLVLENGIYLLAGRPYDGIVEERYTSGRLKSLASYYQGKRHGPTTTFYASGQTREVRKYRAGLSFGRHLGYWDNGLLRFDYAYVDDRREGLQRQWYRSGGPYVALTFRDDKEDGMQQAWRENGKLYINYEAKDGYRYGLQKSSLCSVLVDGVVQ